MPVVIAAGLVTTLAVVVAVSLGTLIFSGPLRGHVAEGIALVLSSTVVVASVSALRSSYPGIVAGPQDNTSIVLAVMATSIAAAAPAGTTGDVLFATVVATIVVGSVLTGITFLVLGRLRLGGLIRYLPYPVIGGFLAGTGWLLVVGGLEVATGAPFRIANVREFAEVSMAVRWLPPATLAAVLLLAVRRSGNLLLFPVVILGAVAAFYAVLAATGVAVAQARAEGWLLGPFSGSAWRPFSVTAVAQADWSLVLGQAGSIVTLVIIAAVSLLLGASGVEIATERDVDLNQELRAAGLANLLAGAGGGAVGYVYTSITVLVHRLEAGYRATGLLVAAGCAALLAAGFEVATLVPLPVIASLLLFLGFAFLADWLVDGRHRMARGDYMIVALIVVAIAGLGLLQGVAVGVVLAVLLFVVRYSRNPAVKHVLDGSAFRSNVERSEVEQQTLADEGACILVLELQGFVFFGSATGVHRLVEAWVGAGRPLRFLVIDFRRVTGVDSSAAFSLVKLHRYAALMGARLVLTGADDHVLELLWRGGLPPEGPLVLADLDHGLEWCEDELLATLGGDSAARSQTTAAEVFEVPPAVLDGYLVHKQYRTGEVLIAHGELAHGLVVVEAGRVTALLDSAGGSPVRLRTMCPGTVVGELGYFLARPATATVIAEEPVRVALLRAEALERMEREAPDLARAVHRRVITLLAERLAASNQVVRVLHD